VAIHVECRAFGARLLVRGRMTAESRHWVAAHECISGRKQPHHRGRVRSLQDRLWKPVNVSARAAIQSASPGREDGGARPSA